MKKKNHTYKELRHQHLLEDNEKEDRLIKQLSKKLCVIKRKPNKYGNKDPKWMKEAGLDYLLSFEKYTDSSSLEKSSSIGCKTTKKRSYDIFGQLARLDSIMDESDTENIDKDVKDVSIFQENTYVPLKNKTNNSDDLDSLLSRDVRRLLNCISTAQMPQIISDLVGLISEQPRAVVRNVLLKELVLLLEMVPLSRREEADWLHQEIAACLICVQAWLSHSNQDLQLVAHLVEFLVKKLPRLELQNESTINRTDSSICVFVAYFYRFGAISGDLILDLIDWCFKWKTLEALQTANQLVIPVGTTLRKEFFQRSQAIIISAKEMVSSLPPSSIELISELQSIVKMLSGKQAKNSCSVNAGNLSRQIRLWTKSLNGLKDMKLPLRLAELLSTDVGGRWWAVGSAVPSNKSDIDATNSLFCSNSLTLQPVSFPGSVIMTKEMEEAANSLGLITPIRRHLFYVLVSTVGGPDHTASALIRAANSGKQATSQHRDREMVQIVMHCLISEQPFNRFYARVLGGLLNEHRRYAIMIRCAFWDVFTKENLTVLAGSNAGKAIGLLASIYGFPLSVFKKYDFSDDSEVNIALLASTIREMSSGSYDRVAERFAQCAGSYPKLGRNMRVFMRRIFKNYDDEACKCFVLRLVSHLRELFP